MIKPIYAKHFYSPLPVTPKAKAQNVTKVQREIEQIKHNAQRGILV